mmetsp:Transcript_35805/g.78171  ORF Transcript_35805/g.78171 Transcript_35805/m.78171 type:complete len:403 (-) Transcript_35805:388-1596(-)
MWLTPRSHPPSHRHLLLLQFPVLLLQLQAAHRVRLDHRQIHLVAEEVANVVDAVENHRGALEREPPRNDADVGGHAHGLHHLRAEHAGVANLHPLLQLRMEAEDLHGGLCVGVVGGLEAQLGDADLPEELVEGADEVAEGEALVADDALNLVELRQVRAVHRLVAEHAVDGEILRRAEPVLRELVEHAARDGGGVRAHEVLLCLRQLPVVVVPDGPVPAVHVRLLHALQVVGGEAVRGLGGGHEEGVVGVAGGVLLRLEERVKVPEGALHKVVGGHLLESHRDEDLAELLPHLQQRVNVPAGRGLPLRVEVVLLELSLLPRALDDHVLREVGRQLHLLERELGALPHLEELLGHGADELPLFESVRDLLVDLRSRLNGLELVLNYVDDGVGLPDHCRHLPLL